MNVLGVSLSANGHWFNPLNAELNPICHLLALLGAHHILHVSRIRVKHGKSLILKWKWGDLCEESLVSYPI
jgi:hypothetical protein